MPLVGIALLSLTKVCQCGQHNGREQGGALEERLTSSEVSLVFMFAQKGPDKARRTPCNIYRNSHAHKMCSQNTQD